MAGARKIVVNGKFLRAEQTGVHRVALELINALAELKREGHPAVDRLDFEVWHTGDGTRRATEVRLPRRLLRPLTGIPWEQLTLAFAPGKALLLSLCNIGPVLRPNAVTMIHDVQVHISPESYGRFFRLWYRLIQPVLGRHNRRILTVSEFSRQKIAEVGLAPLERISVVHNGVDHILREPLEPEALARLGLAEGRYVVALASLQAHKNIGVLLRAFADPRLADLSLVLVGGARAADFAARGHAIGDNVRFAGRVSDGALRTLLEHALCLAFPSTTEGFGLPPLEAMVLGCPAIVAPCGALPEVCGPGALYVEPGDPAGWAAAIDRLARDPALRAERAELGRAHGRAFTWRNAALRLAGVVDGLAENKVKQL
jgi:glycosyltransferase involved in cell wall biosynthesis